MNWPDFRGAGHFLPRAAGAGALAALLAVAACSPTFNWREVQADGELSALLPCKPDRAERALPLGGDRVPLRMAGCEAGGATFAIAWMPGGEPAQASARLGAWQAAARQAWAGAEVAEATAALPRAATTPAPLELRMHGAAAPAAAGARPADARMRWFAHADAQGTLTLYQATVLGHPAANDAADTFFEGLHLR
jgi:hypothetical protein